MSVAFQPTLPGLDPSHHFKVELYCDGEGAECPNDWDGIWKLYSFSNRHQGHKDPEQIGFDRYTGKPNIGLFRKLTTGTAFMVDYSEHGRCRWDLASSRTDWDTSNNAGILLCENPNELRGWDFSKRIKSAEHFCEIYTCWANGDIYGYNVFDSDGESIDGCGRYYGTEEDEKYMISLIHDTIRRHSGDENGVDVLVIGDAEHLWEDYMSTAEQAASRLGHTRG